LRLDVVWVGLSGFFGIVKPSLKLLF
jgi:hypothetical protein